MHMANHRSRGQRKWLLLVVEVVLNGFIVPVVSLVGCTVVPDGVVPVLGGPVVPVLGGPVVPVLGEPVVPVLDGPVVPVLGGPGVPVLG